MGNRTTFFTIDRRLLEEELWTAEPFTKGQAWVDLIGRASYEDTELVKRGELLVSIRTLARRWQWSKGKVERFLKSLENDGMITRDTKRDTNRDTNGTTLRVEKYDFYQSRRDTKRDTNRDRGRDVYNNINNINNISLNMPDGIAEELQQLFGEKTEQLLEDVRAYYEQHPEKDFPGWREAALQFNRNQQRWQHRKRQDPMANAIAAFLAEGEEE